MAVVGGDLILVVWSCLEDYLERDKAIIVDDIYMEKLFQQRAHALMDRSYLFRYLSTYNNIE